jgi:uncharacterized membrane protein YphA (DoxX/SURF4 family)
MLHDEHDRNRQALTILRLTLSLVLFLHGWHRIIEGFVPGLAEGIGTRFPFGLFLAWVVTLMEAVGAPIYALGRFRFPMSVFYVFVYSMAIWMHHARFGWFVSGSDKDGCEFPVLLVAGFVCIAWQSFPFRSAAPNRAAGARA